MGACVPPGAVLDSGASRNAFGELVERIVQQHYCGDLVSHTQGACSLFIPPDLGGARSEFFDENAGVTRCAAMASYLKFHNSQINEQGIVNTCQASHPKPLLVKVPDIISHRLTRREFYEIKPNSPSSIASGVEKIAWFSAICQALPPPAPPLLPYIAGMQYSPNFSHLLSNGAAFGLAFRIAIHIFRPPVVPGLVLYELCPTTNGQTQERCASALMRGSMVMGLLRTHKQPGEIDAIVQSLVRLAETPQIATVGRPGPDGLPALNLPSDVRYVQILLNDWRGRRNLPLIEENSVWLPGGEMDEAIAAVQMEVVSESDGHAPVGGFTTGTLEEGHMRGVFEALDAAEVLPRFTGGTIFHQVDEEDGDGETGVTPEMLSAAIETEMRGYLRMIY